MRASIIVKDDFCAPGHLDLVLASARESGFGAWSPGEGTLGRPSYEGVNFVGRHDLMFRALKQAIPVPIFPAHTFFRSTKPDTAAASIHSDRTSGDWTCIVYLTEHEEISGTGFYAHKKTGLMEMPTIDQMQDAGNFDLLKADMAINRADAWEQTDFIRGLQNRALIFHAPLFHARTGPQTDTADRIVWVCHFYV